MKYNVLDLQKELNQSKIFFDLNDINNNNNEIREKQFLKTRTWDCLDDNKINELDNKIESIFNELNKEKIQKLTTEINKLNFEKFYDSYSHVENMHKIGCICNLYSLIESTCLVDGLSYNAKINEANELSQYIYKFRNILGDGDCYYRGLIFSILENIILTNNIMQMKEILILYHEKININNVLIKEKEYLKIIETMNINIVLEILYIIINQMENDVTKAYTTLLKAFLFSKDFDFGIIYFTRYLIYEYISANEDKIYSKENPVEVGCLLPDQYIEDKRNKNDYFFENFYTLELMNPKTFAEKIVIYIAPFVFNIHINILVYDFGLNGKESLIKEKQFLNENKNNFQAEINLIFRKIHYDVYYKYLFYDDHQKNLNILINRKEDIDNLAQNQINENNKYNDYINNNLGGSIPNLDEIIKNENDNNVKHNNIDNNIENDKKDDFIDINTY